MSGNYFSAKYQEEIGEYEEYSMVQLMGRRAHEFVNRKGSEFYLKGFSFCAVSSNGGAKLFLLSDKVEIEKDDLKVIKTLIATYYGILLPFFPELEKKEKKAEKRAKREALKKANRGPNIYKLQHEADLSIENCL
jgi:hypothetical protein